MTPMFEFAKIYIRSIVGIISTSCVIAYLYPQDAQIIAAYLTAMGWMVWADKGASVE